MAAVTAAMSAGFALSAILLAAGGSAVYSSEQTRKNAHETQDRATELQKQQQQWALEQQSLQMSFQETENAKQRALLEEQNRIQEALGNREIPGLQAPGLTSADTTGAGAIARRRVTPPSYYTTILTSSSGSTGLSNKKTLLGG